MPKQLPNLRRNRRQLAERQLLQYGLVSRLIARRSRCNGRTGWTNHSAGDRAEHQRPLGQFDRSGRPHSDRAPAATPIRSSNPARMPRSSPKQRPRPHSASAACPATTRTMPDGDRNPASPRRAARRCSSPPYIARRSRRSPWNRSSTRASVRRSSPPDDLRIRTILHTVNRSRATSKFDLSRRPPSPAPAPCQIPASR